MRKVKVLQLQPAYKVKGHDFADLAEQIIKGLPSDRYEVVSGYLSGKPKTDGALSKADRSVYFELSGRDLKGLRLKALLQLYRFCKKERFDVVICHRFKPISMMLLLNRWLKVPLCVAILHRMGEFDRFYRRRQIRRYGQRGWRFVGVSSAVRQHLLDYGCGFDNGNTVAIPNAIDIEQAVSLQVPRDEARSQLGLSPDAVIVGVIGRLVSVKGHRFLIEAFGKLKDKHPKAQLAIIGDGSERQNLEGFVEKLNLEGRVHLLGFRPEAMRFVRAFDIWAMPSLSEGLPLALLEAMSGSLPIIASDIPSMRSMVEGAGGQLIAPGDVEGLAKALDNYLAMPEPERLRQGQQAFDYVCREHPIDEYRDRYRRLIEEGLSIE